MSPSIARVPVRDGLFTVEGDGPALLASRCRSCTVVSFPRVDRCPSCGAGGDDVEGAEIGRSGATVWAWTAVNAAPPGYEGPVPYGFGVVELPEGVRVVTRLTESDPSRLSFGQPVHLTVVPVGADGDGTELLTYAFAP